MGGSKRAVLITVICPFTMYMYLLEPSTFVHNHASPSPVMPINPPANPFILRPNKSSSLARLTILLLFRT